MKPYCAVLFLLLLSGFCCDAPLYAQFAIERKIVVENGQFYFFTINEETQLATLYTGLLQQKIKDASKYRFPIGRENREDPNPLSFDIHGNRFVGINWILNSNNSRYEAIKNIDLRDWQKSHSEWTDEDWAQLSFDQPLLAPNEPWQQMLERNHVLDHFFFDLICTDVPVMAICNQGQLSLSHYNGKGWEHSVPVPVPFDEYFSLVSRKGKLGIVDRQGNVYTVDPAANMLQLKVRARGTKPQVLIIDKDKGKNYLLPQEAIDASTFFSVKDLLKESKEITF
jgi:hypothetical protein